MSVLRKNTLVVDFSILPKRPDAGEVEKFLENKVKLQLTDAKCIQLHNLRNVVYIEAIDTETALSYEKANNYKHTITCNNKQFKIPVYVESEAVTVRVHDLPTHTQHRTVTDVMGQYGVVMSIARERWKNHFSGMYNGVRVLRMKLNRPIPSCVIIDGESTLVTYRDQPKTCRHCEKAAHPKQKCAKTAGASTTKTPPQSAPSGSSEPQFNEDEFPLLTSACEDEKSNGLLNSTSANTSEETETQSNENNNTGDNGDDCDDNDDDNEDGNYSSDTSDTNNFIEATSQKRRISKSMKKANEIKKVCLSQGNQNLIKNCNRFQALVGIDAMCISASEIDEYFSRSKDKNKKGNTST